MFDTLHADPDGTLADDDGPFSVPLERLEAQICELAGHLAAATCRFLVLLGDFDARRGWASWDMNSCAEWLSWKCQMSSGTAREHGCLGATAKAAQQHHQRLIPYLSSSVQPRVEHAPGSELCTTTVRSVRKEFNLPNGGRAGCRIVCGTRRWRGGAAPPTR